MDGRWKELEADTAGCRVAMSWLARDAASLARQLTSHARAALLACRLDRVDVRRLAFSMPGSEHQSLLIRTFCGVQGLVHITELSWQKVTMPERVVSVGEDVRCQILSMDPSRGRINLSLKVSLPGT